MNRLKLIIGGRVYCKNGKCGKLSQVVVNPAGWRVTHIVVEEGFLERRSRVFPISVVQQTTTGDIFLSLTEDELSAYPEYQEGLGFIELPENTAGTQAENGFNGNSAARSSGVVVERVQQGFSPELILIERGTPVEYLEDAFGSLDCFLVRPEDGHISGLGMPQPASQSHPSDALTWSASPLPLSRPEPSKTGRSKPEV